MSKGRLLSLIVVIIMVMSVVPMAPQAGAITITSTMSGNQVENVTFQSGGDVDTSVRFLVPGDAHVVNASFDIEGLAVTSNGSFRHEFDPDFENGDMDNVTVVGGDISLTGVDDTWKSPEAWAGASLTNITLEGDRAVLEKLTQAGFIPPRRADENGMTKADDVDIAVDPAGKIHVVYQKDGSNIDYMTSVDNGTNWVLEDSFGSGGGPGMGYFGPQVYAGPNGYIHVFYHQSLSGGSPLVYQRSTNNGSSFSAVSWGWNVMYPSVVWDSDGNMHMAGYTFMLAPPFPYKVYYWNSTDNGATISTPVQLNDDAGDTAVKGKIDIAVDGNDKVHIAWCDGRNGATWWEKEVFYSNSTDHVTFSPNKAVETVSGASSDDVKIDVDPDDKLHLVWSDNRTGDFDIYYTNSTDSGSTFAISRAINDNRGQDQTRPSIGIGDDDTIHVSWDDDSASTGGDIAYTTSEDSGTSFVDSVFVHDEQAESQLESELDLGSDGMPHLVWADSRDGGWKVYYTRMMTSFYTDGEIMGYADLGVPPEALDRVLINAEVPDDTEVNGRIRTSSDNTSWGDWEQVDLDDATISSTPARYVNWVVVLNTTDLMVTPSASNLSIDFSYYMTEGSFVSEMVETGESVSEATVTWNTTAHGDHLTVSISNDNGTTWTDAVKGETIEFAGADNEIKYRLHLTGPGNHTPVLTDIDVSYKAYSYPYKLIISIGSDGNTAWSYSGFLVTKETVYFTETLAEFLEMVATTDDVPVMVRMMSASAGTVSISNINIVLDLPPVIHDSVPVGATPSMDEDSYLVLEVNASDPDGKALTYSWYVNGTLVEGATGATYNHTTTYDGEGTYPVRVNISDGFFTVNRTWTLTVKNVNRMPELVSSVPAGVEVQTDEGTALNLSVVAVDPDDDVLEYIWMVDGKPIVGGIYASWQMDYLSYPGDNNYNVTVKVSDGELGFERSWNVTVSKPQVHPPLIVSWSPNGDVTMEKGSSVDFRVVAEHPDEMPLTYSWSANGKTIEAGSGAGYKFKGEEKGEFVLKVTVSDGERSVSHEWNVTVKDTGSGSSEKVIPWWLILVIIVVIVVVVAVLLLGRKKGPTETTAPPSEEAEAPASQPPEAAPSAAPVQQPPSAEQ